MKGQHLAEVKATLTKVGDPDGDALVEHVENHDDDKADDGGRDRRGHLRCHVLLQRLELLQVIMSEPRGEGKERSQAVDGDRNNGRHDQQNLKDKNTKGKTEMHSLFKICLDLEHIQDSYYFLIIVYNKCIIIKGYNNN